MQRVLRTLSIISVFLSLTAFCGCQAPAQTPPPTAPPPFANPSARPRPLTGDPQSEAQQILLEGLTDIDPRVRANAVEVISTAGAVRLLPKIPHMLQDSALEVRFLAALAVGDLEFALAKEEVTALLNDPDLNVRMAAAYALTKLGQPEHFKIIRDAVTSENQVVRANAALLLGKSGQQQALQYLYWTLRRPDSTDMVLLQAAESIAMLGDHRIYPKLWTRLISAYADDRMIGIRAMGALGNEEAKNALITMLDDTILEVRLAAARELGKLGDTIGESEVQAVFDDNVLPAMGPQSADRIRVLAALAIGEIGTPALAKHLPDLLQEPSPTVRLAAARAVLQIAAQ